MRSLAQVQLAESSVVTGVERNLAKPVKAGHCTASVLFFVPRNGQVLISDWESGRVNTNDRDADQALLCEHLPAVERSTCSLRRACIANQAVC